MQRHAMTEKSKPQQKNRHRTDSKQITGSLNRFYMATTLALRSAVVYTRYLFSQSEGFLTHQCNISENIKSQTNTMMKQRWLDSKN